MLLKVKIEKNRYKRIDVDPKTTLEEIAKEFQKDRPYRILLARVNGDDRELIDTVEQVVWDTPGDELFVDFLDMRTHSADIMYQRGLSMIYLKAVRDLFDAEAVIDNTLNKGFYTKVRLGRDLSDEDVEKIEARMRQIVADDLPIKRIYMSKKDGIQCWKEEGYERKAGMLENIMDEQFRPVFYELDGYTNYFFGPMVPSTGYIEVFELKKYDERGLLLRFPYHGKPDELPEYVNDRLIYEAFRETHDWLALLKSQYLDDFNKIVKNGGVKELILLSEALHEKKVAEIADEITRRGKRIVLIAGPSSSGKTTFARRLCIQLRVNGLQPLYMGTDDYFVERVDTPKDEEGNYNYEGLDAIDIDLFNSNMNDLLAGKQVDLPEFDFIKGVKHFGRRITSIKDNQPIVIEGIHALNNKLTEQIADEHKYKIYISPLTQMNIDIHNRVPSTDGRMLRRMVRDFKYRNHSAAETIELWPKVRAGENENIFPYTNEANVLFNSNLCYETALLKKYAEPLLKQINPGSPQYSEAQRLLEFLKFYEVIEEEQYVPNNSIMREFIGGSVFTE
ncbi:MAG: nucleoside kinase [Firmicutes bacterium]|nr:nucleoside kinase [Bacillota bacterium]